MKEKTRVFVLTDISSLTSGFKEPDDTRSLVRLLLYTNEFEVEGLAATYSKHWQGEVKPEYIHAVIDEYSKVWDNLVGHDPAFPTPRSLHGLVKTGNANDGPAFVGEGHDTEASDWLLSRALKEDDRPLWFSSGAAQPMWRRRSGKLAALCLLRR